MFEQDELEEGHSRLEVSSQQAEAAIHTADEFNSSADVVILQILR